MSATKRKQRKPSNPFAYMLAGEPEVQKFLQSAGIELVALHRWRDEAWPALKLPNGKFLAIAADDEGNGPGSIWVV